jgi:hypothetical protein
VCPVAGLDNHAVNFAPSPLAIRIIMLEHGTGLFLDSIHDLLNFIFVA